MPVLKDIFQVDNFVGIGADGKHGNLMQNVHGAVNTFCIDHPNTRGKFGGVGNPRFSMDTFSYGAKISTENIKKIVSLIFIFRRLGNKLCIRCLSLVLMNWT